MYCPLCCWNMLICCHCCLFIISLFLKCPCVFLVLTCCLSCCVFDWRSAKQRRSQWSLCLVRRRPYCRWLFVCRRETKTTRRQTSLAWPSAVRLLHFVRVYLNFLITIATFEKNLSKNASSVLAFGGLLRIN